MLGSLVSMRAWTQESQASDAKLTGDVKEHSHNDISSTDAGAVSDPTMQPDDMIGSCNKRRQLCAVNQAVG